MNKYKEYSCIYSNYVKEWLAARKKAKKMSNLQVPKDVKLYLEHIDFPVEFLDVHLIVKKGAKKHGKDTWKDKNNPSLEKEANYASMCRHLAKYYAGNPIDKESGYSHLLHLACRALMKYSRIKKRTDTY